MTEKKDPPDEGKSKETGRFLPGNRFWEARSTHGRKPIFATPDDLRAACVEYFEWVEGNPLHEDKLVIFQGKATHEPVAKMRAMTLGGLCLFLDISFQGWTEYSKKPDFSDVSAWADNVIRSQKFAGAAADLLNANIIARDLGLADKRELAGPNGGPVAITSSDNPQEAAEKFANERRGENSGE